MATHSCLENPRDGGAWWAAVSGVAQSRTQLKRLSSSSSSYVINHSTLNDFKWLVEFLQVQNLGAWLGGFVWDLNEITVRCWLGLQSPESFPGPGEANSKVIHTQARLRWLVDQSLSSSPCGTFFILKSIVTLHCWISFCGTPKWISYRYTYIPSFLDFLPI